MRTARWVGPTFLLVILLSACGGAQPTGQASGAGGGTINVALNDAAGILNPEDYTGNHVILTMIFDSLVTYAADGTIKPGLAESWEQASDGKSVTFKLRTDVKFHDGTAFDATAAKWNFDRWVGQKTHDWLGIANLISSVEASDATTLRIDLKQAYSPFFQELTFTRPVRFLSPTSVNADGSFAKPIGTGPWKFESDEEGISTTLVRNDDYWGAKSAIDKVVFKVLPDPQARAAALEAGEIDIVGGEYLAPLGPEQVASLKSKPELTVFAEPGSTTLIMGFNTERPALQDAAVRRAINMAIDRKGISTALFAGLAEPAGNVFPPVIPDTDDTSTTPPTFDPTAAAAELEGAGWTGSPVRSKDGTPLSLELITSDGSFPQARGVSEAIKSQLAAIGVEVNIRPLDAAGYGSALDARSYDMAFHLTFGAPFDPSSTLSTLYKSSTFSDDGKVFSAPELDAMIDDALAATTDEARKAAYGSIWKFLDDESADAPIVFQSRLWAAGKAVKGFALGSSEYDLPLAGVTIVR